MEIYYLHLDDEQKGPFTIGQLQEMWKAGIITMKTPFWNKVIGEWKMLDSILELLEPSQTSSSSLNVTPTVSRRRRKQFSVFRAWRLAGVLTLWFLLIGLVVVVFLALHGPRATYSSVAPSVSTLTPRPTPDAALARATSDTARAFDDGLNRGHFLGQAEGREGKPIPSSEALHSVALRMANNSPFEDKEAWALAFKNGFAAGYREATKKAF